MGQDPAAPSSSRRDFLKTSSAAMAGALAAAPLAAGSLATGVAIWVRLPLASWARILTRAAARGAPMFLTCTAPLVWRMVMRPRSRWSTSPVE